MWNSREYGINMDFAFTFPQRIAGEVQRGVLHPKHKTHSTASTMHADTNPTNLRQLNGSIVLCGSIDLESSMPTGLDS